MKKIIYILIALTFIISSCDKIEGPYIEEGHGGGGDDSSTYVQKVLIEDYTAHKCVNCPRAALQIEDLQAVYGDKIIPLALHVSSLAYPQGPPYDLDLLCSVGIDLDNEFGCSSAGLPNGMINRTVYNSNILVGDGDWPSAVSIILENQPLVGIDLTSNIDTINKKLGLDVKIVPLQDINTADKVLKVCAYITESNIIGAQYDLEAASGEVLDYVFMHVLRSSCNGTWGERVSTDDLIQNNPIEKSFTNVSIDSDWDFHNLGAVVFVYDSLTNEVVQAENIEFEVH